MSDPVSWLMIEPGWDVAASDGSKVGEVNEVAGDDRAGIFDGLAIALSAFGRPRYVPAEDVASITDGVVHLALTRDQVERLGEYLEPATSAQIEPDDRGGVGESIRAELRELEGDALAPIERHEQPVSPLRRVYFFFKRRLS